MMSCLSLTILLFVFCLSCEAAHNCTSFNDKNHGYGCELRNVKPDQEVFEINVMSKDDTNRTEADVVWVQIRDSEFDSNLPKGVFEKFVNMQKLMILSSKGFKNLDTNYFDKKISLILMKNTDVENVGESCFTGLENLKILSLNYNSIKTIHKSAFRDLVNMEKIEMVYNSIEALDDDTFANNVNLKLVLLYNNKIKVISTQLFLRNVNIESLQLQNNVITQIEKGFHTELKKLTRVDFSSNVCISESIVLTRYIQWSSHLYKFKDCYNNYALMKSSNDVVNSVQKKVEGLETKVDVAVERVNNDMKILEGKLANTTAFEDLKTNLLDFFSSDQQQFKQTYENDLNNITSHVRTEMIEEIEKKVETVLGKSQETRQERLVSDDFQRLREDFSGKFSFIHCMLFLIVCFGCATTLFIFFKLNVIPMLKNSNGDDRHLIDSENC